MIDVIARSQRLMGKEVFFPWGVDRNGINIEFTVEKNTGKKMKTYDRSEFLKLCEETIEEYTQAMRDTASRVGLSCDFEKEYLTTQLKKFGGNISKTAKFVGMERSALHRKLKGLGIKEFN